MELPINPFLKANLIFKGGTVLKKVYFPHYRFSEDLDFTYQGKDFDTKVMMKAFSEISEMIYEDSKILLSVKGEKHHETGNLNFYFSYSGPLGGTGANKDIKIDISQDELIYNAPEEMNILNAYSDLKQVNYSMLCYTIGEVMAEKMRSVMQRTAPRDIYDLWYLLEIEGENIEDYIFAFQDKAKYKGYNSKDFIKVVEQKHASFSKHWNSHLANQMTEIPDFNDVWRTLGKHWRKLRKLMA